MKYLFSFLVVLFTSIAAHAETRVASEYVSIDCPQGDITLILKKNGAFFLELKHWDPKLNQHTHSETLSGIWRLAGKDLILSGNVKIDYQRETTAMAAGIHSDNIDSFKWRKSSRTTFADTFTLLERKAADDLLLRAVVK